MQTQEREGIINGPRSQKKVGKVGPGIPWKVYPQTEAAAFFQQERRKKREL